MTQKIEPRLFPKDPAPPAYGPGGSAVSQLIDGRTGASMAAGTACFQDSEIPFTLWYDELLFCHEVEDRFEIVVGEAVHSMHTGDMIWLPAGTSLIYRSKGSTVCFFAVSPGDYEEKKR